MDDLLKADNWGSVEISDIGPFKSLFSAAVEGGAKSEPFWLWVFWHQDVSTQALHASIVS